MSIEFLVRHWSLVAASVIATAIALFVLFRVFTDSARGQLRGRVRTLDRCYRDAARARTVADKADSQLTRLRSNSSRVKPRHLQEASEALQDARALLKIADDQVLVAENHVRKIIVEEFAPARQDALRRRFLKRPEDSGKPFTF